MIKDKIIVLNVIKHGEADLIVKGLNGEGNKLALFARSALRSKKRFGGGVLEPLHYIEVDYKESKSENGLGVLNEARIVEEFRSIRKDYDKIQLGLQMLQVVERYSQEGLSENQVIFRILGNSLKSLETSENLEKLRMLFELKILQSQGVMPRTDEVLSLVKFPIKNHADIDLPANKKSVLQRLLKKAHEYAIQ